MLTFDHIKNLVYSKKPFCLIRFSDGEIEIIRNRKLIINKGKTEFRGMKYKNNFLEHDNKTFIPSRHQSIRKHLIEAVTFYSRNYFIGIPGSHNNMLRDAELLIRLSGYKNENFTFSDILVNENFSKTKILYNFLLKNYNNIYIIGNERAKDSVIAKKNNFIPVCDNFFNSYDQQLSQINKKVENIPSGSIILSSASSMSNVIGYRLWKKRQDVTFIDAGTSINFLLNLKGNRVYSKSTSLIYYIMSLKFLFKNNMRL